MKKSLGSNSKYYKTFKEKLMPIINKLIQKIEEGTLCKSLCEALISKTRPSHQNEKKENSRPISQMNIGAKIPN